MDITTLLADPAAINLDLLVSNANSITLVVRTVQPRPGCPKCGQASTSLHSHYQRKVADLPWHGVTIKLQLSTRKLRCKNDLCSQKVFCERLPVLSQLTRARLCGSTLLCKYWLLPWAAQQAHAPLVD